MMVLLFLLLLISVIFIWFGKRNIAIIFFLVDWSLGLVWFFHHATSHLNLSL